MSAVNAGAPLTALDSARTRARSHSSLVLTVCCLAQFMVILDVSIVNVALPSIQRSLGFSETELQWVVNAYTITFAGFLMLSGRAADLFGGRRTFVTGLLLFSLASLVGGTAASRQILIGARALQGLGGAVMAASSLAIITYSFAAGPERHRAIGLWGAMNGAGGATGTLLGGIITQELSWRWVLLINLPIGIVAALVARAVIAEGRHEGPRPSFDLAGALAVTLGLLSLVYGIVNAGADGWGSAAALGPIVAGIALLGMFFVIEGRWASAPLVPLRVFSNRLLRISNLVVILLSAALFPMWYFCSLYLQKVLHFGPLDAGLAFLPMALTLMAFATQAGWLVGRFGAGRVLSFGLALMTLGLALFARGISVHGSYLSSFLIPGMLASIGIGLSIVPSTIAATATAAPGEAGLASGLVNTSRQMGGALGLAILASLAVLYTNHLVDVQYRAEALAVTDGFRLAFGLAAVFTAVGAVVALRFIPASLRPPAPALAPVAPAASAGPSGSAAPAPSASSRTACRTRTVCRPRGVCRVWRWRSVCRPGSARRTPALHERGERSGTRCDPPHRATRPPGRAGADAQRAPDAARRERVAARPRRDDARERRPGAALSRSTGGAVKGLGAAAACLLAGGILAGACGSTAVDSAEVLPANASLAVAAADPITISPLPGTEDASPATQISFLGPSGTTVGHVRVVGSRSGTHAGVLRAYSTGTGESFLTSRPFAEGERVAVSARVLSGPMRGRVARSAFTVADQSPISQKQFPTAAGDPNDVQHYVSAPALTPSSVRLLTHAGPQATPGDLLMAPYQGRGTAGPMIVAQDGSLIWFHPLPAGMAATNLTVQSFGGEPVLEWWQGRILELGFGQGEDVIANSSYREIATVRAGNGYRADLHVTRITPEGTAWIDAYDPVRDEPLVGRWIRQRGPQRLARAGDRHQDRPRHVGVARARPHSARRLQKPRP